MSAAFVLPVDDDVVTQDPSICDPKFPAEHLVTHFISQESVVHASLWLAQGPHPKGTVVVSSQRFGGDRLESLFIPLMNAGLNVMTFHPRGMWDDSVEYTSMTAIEDVHAAIEYLRSSDAVGKQALSGNGYRVDPTRIGVLGLSGGGGTVAYAACAENADISFAVAIAPSNHELLRGVTASDHRTELSDAIYKETAGRVDMHKSLSLMRPEDTDRLSIIAQAAKLVDKKLLLVGAAQDTVSPIEQVHYPLTTALTEAGAKHLTSVILDTDHMFLTKRVALAQLVVKWLRAEGIC